MSAVAIYEGTAGHRHSGPDHRTFSPRLFLTYVDVDALPGALDRLPGWSARRPAPVHYRARDFATGDGQPVGDAIRDLVQERLGRRPDGPVYLLAQLRTWGYVFNPLAVYYCWNASGDELDAVVLEVTNMPWRERHWYVFGAGGGLVAGTEDKAMYVSPFLPLDARYHVSWTPPGEELAVRIHVEHGDATVFGAALSLHRVPLTRCRALTLPFRSAMLPQRGVLGIYRHALALWFRRFPITRHVAPTPKKVTA